MKRIAACFSILLVIITLVVPSFVFSQQRAQASIPADRKNNRAAARTAATNLERDFDEALKVIQEQYVGGRQLDYNSVFKSSIIGMLRSLDPHSNYYDRDEFDELKTDQRSEYHGIGASI